ncbi:MAG: PspC domain-containing protein [Spirochaetia bacterium]|nr:PspC domain-containing protein [Spirochaetia bacterium]MCF7953752.1 PspC domain-containing protein [Spirochaetales bacterium]
MAAYYGRKLYRSKHGELFGVCQGLADWRDLPVGPIRLIVILLAVFSGFIPILLLYVLAALILPVEPGYQDRRSDFYDDNIGSRYKNSRRKTAEDLKEEFENLKSKVSGMESKVFDEERGKNKDKEKEWEERFKKGD